MFLKKRLSLLLLKHQRQTAKFQFNLLHSITNQGVFKKTKGVYICIKMVHLCHLKKLGDTCYRIAFFLGCTSIQDTRLRVVDIKKHLPIKERRVSN